MVIDKKKITYNLQKAIKDNNISLISCTLLACIIFGEKNNMNQEEIDKIIKASFLESIKLNFKKTHNMGLFKYIYELIEKTKFDMGDTFLGDVLLDSIHHDNWEIMEYILKLDKCKVLMKHMLKAINKGNRSVLIQLFESSNNTVDIKSSSCLICYSCKYDYVYMIDWLINNGCKITFDNIKTCIEYGSVECLKHLLGRGCYINYTHLEYVKQSLRKALTEDVCKKIKECEYVLIEHLRKKEEIKTTPSYFKEVLQDVPNEKVENKSCVLM